MIRRIETARNRRESQEALLQRLENLQREIETLKAQGVGSVASSHSQVAGGG